MSERLPIPITPENPPQFPCWLFLVKSRRWKRAVLPLSPFMLKPSSHWHPDQPEAPTGIPTVPTSFPDRPTAPSSDTVPAWAMRASFPNHPCHYWQDITPEDATENEIEIVHQIAGDPMQVRGMTREQARLNYRGCAKAIRELTRHAPTTDATTYTKSYSGGRMMDDNPLAYITIKSGHQDVIRVPAHLLRALLRDLIEVDGWPAPDATAGALREIAKYIHEAATDKAHDVMTDPTWALDYSLQFTLTVKQLRAIDGYLKDSK